MRGKEGRTFLVLSGSVLGLLSGKGGGEGKKVIVVGFGPVNRKKGKGVLEAIRVRIAHRRSLKEGEKKRNV